MSQKNSPENKRLRRIERTEHKEIVEKKRVLQKRFEYLFYSPPETVEELEAEVDRAIQESGL